MSLIEQLGGCGMRISDYKHYNQLKESLDAQKIAMGDDLFYGTEIRFKLIEELLLQHRRENNIFEEHDWVVIPSRGNGLFGVSRLLCRSDRDEMCHATDKEIAQGYRDE